MLHRTKRCGKHSFLQNVYSHRFMHLWACMHLMRAHIHNNVSASRFDRTVMLHRTNRCGKHGFYKTCTGTIFMHLWARMHLMWPHINVNVSVSPFHVLIEPGCSTGPIDVENMVFYKMCTGTVFMHLWASMHLMRAHIHVNVSASPFHVPIEPGCSIGPIDVEHMIFRKCVPAPFQHLWARMHLM